MMGKVGRLFFLCCFSAKLYAVPAKTFVYCSEGSPSSFNPQIANDGTTFNATKAIYSHLVQFKYGETQVIPDLAESWKFRKMERPIRSIFAATCASIKRVPFRPRGTLMPTMSFFLSIASVSKTILFIPLETPPMSTSTPWRWAP